MFRSNEIEINFTIYCNLITKIKLPLTYEDIRGMEGSYTDS
jgi:hypothetical protein